MSWTCPICQGAGKVFGRLDEIEDCPKCNGLGYTTTPPASAPSVIDYGEEDDE